MDSNISPLGLINLLLLTPMSGAGTPGVKEMMNPSTFRRAALLRGMLPEGTTDEI